MRDDVMIPFVFHFFFCTLGGRIGKRVRVGWFFYCWQGFVNIQCVWDLSDV